jgi:hypothetical protein
MSKKISSRLTAVAFAAALTCAGTAQAGPLALGTGSGTEASSWSLAWDWLTEVWGDLTGLRSDSQSTVTTSGESTGGGGTTNAGCGIDPNGSPCGGA